MNSSMRQINRAFSCRRILKDAKQLKGLLKHAVDELSLGNAAWPPDSILSLMGLARTLRSSHAIAGLDARSFDCSLFRCQWGRHARNRA